MVERLAQELSDTPPQVRFLTDEALCFSYASTMFEVILILAAFGLLVAWKVMR
jgi:hypothetical protein